MKGQNWEVGLGWGSQYDTLSKATFNSVSKEPMSGPLVE